MHFAKPDGYLMGITNLTKIRRVRIFGTILLVFFLLYSITGFFILPYYIKGMATEQLSRQLGRSVVINSVRFNPYSLAVTISGFEIKEADGRATFVSFRRLYVNLQAVSVFKGGPVVREIKLEKPHVHLVRTDANTYNFSAVLDRFLEKREVRVQERAGKPVLFSFSNIQIIDGDIEFDDRPVSKRHEITQINLTIPFISDLPSYVDSFVQPSLDATINGTPVHVRGATQVFSDSHETSLDISLKDIDIPTYAAYVPMKLNVKVASGRLDMAMKVTYRQFTNRQPMLAITGESRIRDFRISTTKAQEDILKVSRLSIRDISMDMETRKIEISAIATERGWIAISRSPDGRMSYESFIAAPPAASPPARTSSSSDRTGRVTPAEAPWIISLKSIVVDAYTVQATDRSLAKPFSVTLDEISCKAQNISTEKDAKGTIALSLRIDRTGSGVVDGTFTLSPLATDLAVRLSRVRLKLMQPFLAGHAQVLLAAGTLNAKGALKARETGKEGLNAVMRGRLWIDKLSLLDSVDAEDLLKWDSLSLEGIEARYAPLSLHIREIVLSKFYSRIIINADRTVNLLEAFSAAEPAGETAPPLQEPPLTKATTSETQQEQEPAQQRTIGIDKISLQGGTINFTDNSMKMRFSSNLFDIKGRISGLSSDENTLGEVELSGAYDRYAPLQITGKINPLRNDLYVALTVDFRDMDLTSISPYAGRYAGYAVEKGKLSFQLHYLIQKNKLDAQHNVLIDQFTFGDPVESPDATKLPVRLAVALLKDRNGEIHLDLPVSGELNDPQFRVGRVVLKIIVNLLEKAATSPFALLGAVFGGGEQIGYAEFDYGSAALTDAVKKKLDILEKALSERPSLRMDIIGHADPEQDREGLKQSRMQQKIRAQKIRELAGKKDETSSLESVTVSPQEYPLLLKRAYKEEKFPKPTNFLGIAKDVPVPEMEKLMLDNMKVTDEDLKALAD